MRGRLLREHDMAIYRITIILPNGKRARHLGIFADGFEAIVQTLADYPDASRVSAHLVEGSRT